jgi:xanthine dehydrogenase YagR molybdenum-binding subunit
LVAQEIAMDELAERIGVDPIELRLLNYADRDPMKNMPWSSKALRECYEQGAARFGWERRVPAPGSMRTASALVGFGMATAMYTANRYPTSASATLYSDGHVVVRSATTDMGPGTYTSATQIAADALGLPLDRVRFELGDSSYPNAKEHGGSTTLASVGPAVLAACAALTEKLEVIGGRMIDAADSLRRAGLASLEATGDAIPGDVAKTHALNGFGAVFAEVHVDPDFGTISVRRLVGAYDAGRIVNPRLAQSQCIGGMVGGIGMALMEEAEWDENLGRVVNATMAEYLVPVSADIHELEAIFVDTQEPMMNPLGVKGVAELGLCGVAPAIANAVWHATGKRVRQLPMTPDRLLLA